MVRIIVRYNWKLIYHDKKETAIKTMSFSESEVCFKDDMVAGTKAFLVYLCCTISAIPKEGI